MKAFSQGGSCRWHYGHYALFNIINLLGYEKLYLRVFEVLVEQLKSTQ